MSETKPKEREREERKRGRKKRGREWWKKKKWERGKGEIEREKESLPHSRTRNVATAMKRKMHAGPHLSPKEAAGPKWL